MTARPMLFKCPVRLIAGPALAALVMLVVLWVVIPGNSFAQAEAPGPAAADDRDFDPEVVRLRESQKRIEKLSSLFARQNRVYRIAYRLLYAAVDMCPDRLRVATGFTYANAYLFQGSVRSAASAMGYGHRVTVVDVAPNGAAARAGIQARDIFMAIDDWPVPFGEGAVTLAAAKLRDVLTREGNAALTFRRGASSYSVTVKPDYICDYRVLAVPGNAIKAYADGERVVVFQGVLEFVGADDDALASVIAREIANNLIPAMNIDASDGKNDLSNFFYWGMEPEASGDPFDDLARAVDHKIAADYVGAYLLTRAGFDHEKFPDFWYLMANAGLGGQGQNYPAPDPEYLVRLEATVDELNTKLGAREPLRPEPTGPPPADPDALIMLTNVFPVPAPVVDAQGKSDDAMVEAHEDQAPISTPPHAAIIVAGLPWTEDVTTQPAMAAPGDDATGIDDMPWRDQADNAGTRSLRDNFGDPNSATAPIESPTEAATAVTVTPLEGQSAPTRANPIGAAHTGFSFHDWFSG